MKDSTLKTDSGFTPITDAPRKVGRLSYTLAARLRAGAALLAGLCWVVRYAVAVGFDQFWTRRDMGQGVRDE